MAGQAPASAPRAPELLPRQLQSCGGGGGDLREAAAGSVGAGGGRAGPSSSPSTAAVLRVSVTVCA